MKRPFDFVTDSTLETLNKSKANFLYNFEHLDKILVWVIGFSIVAISLIASSITNLNQTYSCNVLHSILLLLSFSIFFGILFRITSLLFLVRYQNILFGLESAFSKQKIMRMEVAVIEPDLGIHKIQQKIKQDFDADYSDIIELYNQATDDKSKEHYLNYLVQEYNRLSIWAKNEYDYSINYVMVTFGKAFKLNEKQTEKMFKKKPDAFYLKLWSILRLLSILISIFSFLTVLLILAICYR